MPDVSSGAVDLLSRRAVDCDASRGGLAKPLIGFIGRERELARAKRLLQGSCLVTLTGPGGSGETRLCIALAAEVAAEYPDGVFFVRLVPVRDPRLVPSTIAQSIGLQDVRDRSLMAHLVSQLGERQLLLVVDIFEHLRARRTRGHAHSGVRAVGLPARAASWSASRCLVCGEPQAAVTAASSPALTASSAGRCMSRLVAA